MINDHSAFRIDGMPFAGLKQSGLGIGGIPYTMDDMQIEKMAVMHSPDILWLKDICMKRVKERWDAIAVLPDMKDVLRNDD